MKSIITRVTYDRKTGEEIKREFIETETEIEGNFYETLVQELGDAFLRDRRERHEQERFNES